MDDGLVPQPVRSDVVVVYNNGVEESSARWREIFVGAAMAVWSSVRAGVSRGLAVTRCNFQRLDTFAEYGDRCHSRLCGTEECGDGDDVERQ
jgi:hypothetical protein